LTNHNIEIGVMWYGSVVWDIFGVPGNSQTENKREDRGIRTVVNKCQWLRSWMTKSKTCVKGQDKLADDDLRLFLTLRKYPLGMPSKQKEENSRQYYMYTCSGVELRNKTVLAHRADLCKKV
jgi:hypothetical protein